MSLPLDPQGEPFDPIVCPDCGDIGRRTCPDCHGRAEDDDGRCDCEDGSVPCSCIVEQPPGDHCVVTRPAVHPRYVDVLSPRQRTAALAEAIEGVRRG